MISLAYCVRYFTVHLKLHLFQVKTYVVNQQLLKRENFYWPLSVYWNVISNIDISDPSLFHEYLVTHFSDSCMRMDTLHVQPTVPWCWECWNRKGGSTKCCWSSEGRTTSISDGSFEKMGKLQKYAVQYYKHIFAW